MHGEKRKRTGGIRKQFFGSYKTELSSLCEHGTIPLQSRAQANFFLFCVLHHPALTQEQNQSSSVTFLGFIFVTPFPVHPRKSHHTVCQCKTPFNLCKTSENVKDDNLVLGPSSAVDVLLLKAVLC